VFEVITLVIIETHEIVDEIGVNVGSITDTPPENLVRPPAPFKGLLFT
jgi:hypothetical protein